MTMSFFYPFSERVVDVDALDLRRRRVHLADEDELRRLRSDDVTGVGVARDAAENRREVALDHENAAEMGS